VRARDGACRLRAGKPPVQQKVTRYLEPTGYASAISTTNLVARVQGFLQKIN
jgi:hypothetical protein